jgi:predicted Zn-dependent protease
MDDAVQQLEAWLEVARLGGARGCEILRVGSKTTRFGVRRGAAENVTETTTDTAVVRVWLDGGRAGVARGDMTAGSALVQAALTAAASADPDPYAGPVDQLERISRGLGIADRRYKALGMDDRMGVVGGLERSVSAIDSRLTTSDITWSDALSRRTWVSSRGARFDEWDTLFEGTVTVAGSGHGDRLIATESVASRSFASLASVPYAANLARVVAAALQDKPSLKPGPVRVVFAPAATARLFEQIATGLDQATLASDGHFLAREGKPVPVHRRIHLLDDGQAPGGLRTHGFDDRGVIPRPITLLKEGRLDEPLLDLRAARAAERDPTGHWFDGLRPSNLSLRGGTRSINAITAELGGTMLLVEHLPDLSGALDLRTGRLDCPVFGQVLDGKKRVGVVRGRRLVADLAEALGSVVQVCSNTDRVRHVDAPGIIMDGFTLV